jgi:hypothetical protein
MSKAHHLLAGLLATTALSVPALAFAEETPDAVDAVVVTGQREAQRAAIAVKREPSSSPTSSRPTTSASCPTTTPPPPCAASPASR